MVQAQATVRWGYLYGWRALAIAINSNAAFGAPRRPYLAGYMGGVLKDVIAPPATCAGFDRSIAIALGLKRTSPEGHFPGDPAPEPRCTCGYYALKEPDLRCTPYVAPTPAFVWAYVLLYGRVVEHEHGWRAERYRIEAFVIPKLPRQNPLLHCYSSESERIHRMYYMGQFGYTSTDEMFREVLPQYNCPVLSRRALRVLPTGWQEQQVSI